MGVSRAALVIVGLVLAAALASVAYLAAQTYIELQNIVPLKVWQYDTSANLYVIYGEDINTGKYYAFLYDASTNAVVDSVEVPATSVFLIDYDMFNHYLFVYNPDTGKIDRYIVSETGFSLDTSIPTPNNNANAFVAVGTYSRLVVIDEPNLYAYIIAYNGTVVAQDGDCFKARPIGVDFTRGYVLMGQPSSMLHRICLVKVAEAAFTKVGGPSQVFTVYRAGVVDSDQGLWIAVKNDGSTVIFFNESALGSPVEISTNISMSGVAYHGFLEESGIYYFAAYDSAGVHVYKVVYNGTTITSFYEVVMFNDKSYPELSRDPDGNMVIFYYDPYAGKPAVQQIAQVTTVTTTATVTKTKTVTETRTVTETTTVFQNVTRTVTTTEYYVKYYTVTAPATTVTVTEYARINASPVTVIQYVPTTVTTTVTTSVPETRTTTYTTTVEGTETVVTSTYTTVVPKTVTTVTTLMVADGYTTITSPWYVVQLLYTPTNVTMTTVINETVTMTTVYTTTVTETKTFGDNYAMVVPVLAFGLTETETVPIVEEETVTVTETVTVGEGYGLSDLVIVAAIGILLGTAIAWLLKRR